MDKEDDTQTRDFELGGLLATVDADEHHEGFWDDVRRRVEPELRRVSRPGLRDTRRRAVMVAAVAAVVAVALLLGIVLPWTRDTVGPQEATAAEVVVEALTSALSSSSSVQGDFVQRTTVTGERRAPAWAEWHGSFAATSRGDFRYEIALARVSDGVGGVGGASRASADSASRDDSAPSGKTILKVLEPVRYISLYDAGDFVSRWAAWDVTGQLTDSGSTTRWPHAPWYTSSEDYLQLCDRLLEQAALVRAAVAGDPDLPVHDVVYDSRPAWELTIDLPSSVVGSRRMTVTVDKATGFPVRMVLVVMPSEASDSDPHSDSPYSVEFRVDDLVLGEDVPRDVFTTLPEGVPTPASPTGSLTVSADNAVTPCSLDEAVAVAGFSPLVPEPLPSGFSLSTASTTAMEAVAAPGSGAISNNAAEIDLMYSRGLDWIEVDTVRFPPIVHGTILDELEDSGGSRSPLSAGSLAGQTAYTWRGSGPVYKQAFSNRVMLPFHADPSLVVVGTDTFVWVRGTVSRDEMVEIANSLRAYEP